MRTLFIAICCWSLTSVRLQADEHVRFRRGAKSYDVTGRVIVEATDGGILLLGNDNVLWDVQPDELVSRHHDEEPLVFLEPRELEAKVLAELSGEFRTHRTRHYLIIYDTSRAYAQWVGGLYEQLHTAFTTFWRRMGIDMQSSDTLLVGLVFRDQASYLLYARQELDAAAESIIGYYSLHTNRIAMYDLTGAAVGSGRGLRSRILAARDAERMVATVIHEATHQLAFNSGLQSRAADVPVWLSEGIAMYFETPDLSSRKGWRSLGAVNPMRAYRYDQYRIGRPADSLRTLLQDDTRFRHTGNAEDAYAEAWLLCHYLMRRHPEAFVHYIKTLARRKPQIPVSPDERIGDFLSTVAGDLESLDRELQDYFIGLQQ